MVNAILWTIVLREHAGAGFQAAVGKSMSIDAKITECFCLSMSYILATSNGKASRGNRCEQVQKRDKADESQENSGSRIVFAYINRHETVTRSTSPCPNPQTFRWRSFLPSPENSGDCFFMQFILQCSVHVPEDESVKTHELPDEGQRIAVAAMAYCNLTGCANWLELPFE